MHRLRVFCLLVVLGTTTTSCAGLSNVTDSPQSVSAPPATDISLPSTVTPLTASDLCVAAFGQDQLLAWVPATAGSIRQWHYGGPTPQFPMSHVFPSVDDVTQSAWCETRGINPANYRWWVVTSGQAPVPVLGSDWGRYQADEPQGELSQPPVVP